MASDLASVARAAVAKAKAEKAEDNSDELAFEEERQYPGLEQRLARLVPIGRRRARCR